MSSEQRQLNVINYIGVKTLLRKEIFKFLRIYRQTIIGPVFTSLIFLTIFTLAFGKERVIREGISFSNFLVPGLIMMMIIQNSFANTSTSIMISKVENNLVDLLMSPIRPIEMMFCFICAGIVRGFIIAIAALLVMSLFINIHVQHFGIAILFVLLAGMAMSQFGMIAAIVSEKFDHIATFTNFVITPLSFLSGTFYNLEKLQGVWQYIAIYNPFFYMIDGFRYGFLGVSDMPITRGISILVFFNMILFITCFQLLRTGYKLKS